MQDSKMLNMLKMIEPYLIYPDDDNDFRGIIYLPLKDDALFGKGNL